MTLEYFLGAITIGLLGAGHCLGMCGGISAALTFAVDAGNYRQRLYLISAYNFGRVMSYAIAGAIVAGTAEFAIAQSAFPVLRIVAGALLILMGLYIADVWKILTVLERLGHAVWKRIAPLGNKLMPVQNVFQALALGCVWGWLPCGLIYTALVFSATSANAISGAMIMAAFGIGTFPAVLMGGLAGESLKSVLKGVLLRRVMALCLVVFGIWTIVIALQHAGHHHGATMAGFQDTRPHLH